MKFTKKELVGIIKICDAVSKVKDSMASEFFSEIRKANPKARYRIQTTNRTNIDGRNFIDTYYYFDYGLEKLNKDFISYLYKNYRVRKVSDYVFKAYNPNDREESIDVEIDRLNPEVRVSVYEERK